jgi:hypothetical protein
LEPLEQLSGAASIWILPATEFSATASLHLKAVALIMHTIDGIKITKIMRLFTEEGINLYG